MFPGLLKKKIFWKNLRMFKKTLIAFSRYQSDGQPGRGVYPVFSLAELIHQKVI
jgi:hypothetical protein